MTVSKEIRGMGFVFSSRHVIFVLLGVGSSVREVV